jgi:hypothetical protein
MVSEWFPNRQELASTLVYLWGMFLSIRSTDIERFVFVTGQNSARARRIHTGASKGQYE